MPPSLRERLVVSDDLGDPLGRPRVLLADAVDDPPADDDRLPVPQGLPGCGRRRRRTAFVSAASSRLPQAIATRQIHGMRSYSGGPGGRSRAISAINSAAARILVDDRLAAPPPAGRRRGSAGRATAHPSVVPPTCCRPRRASPTPAAFPVESGPRAERSISAPRTGPAGRTTIRCSPASSRIRPTATRRYRLQSGPVAATVPVSERPRDSITNPLPADAASQA